MAEVVIVHSLDLMEAHHSVSVSSSTVKWLSVHVSFQPVSGVTIKTVLKLSVCILPVQVSLWRHWLVNLSKRISQKEIMKWYHKRISWKETTKGNHERKPWKDMKIFLNLNFCCLVEMKVLNGVKYHRYDGFRRWLSEESTSHTWLDLGVIAYARADIVHKWQNHFWRQLVDTLKRKNS